MTTDTSERGLERLICTALTGAPCDPGAVATDEIRERTVTYGVSWICGSPKDYNREYCVDFARVLVFLSSSAREPDRLTPP